MKHIQEVLTFNTDCTVGMVRVLPSAQLTIILQQKRGEVDARQVTVKLVTGHTSPPGQTIAEKKNVLH